jgi:flagellar biosynthetic protein FlhB
MSEDRTQPPSKRRRQLAREQGQAVHSPELTAACGWLVAVLLLGYRGGDLVQGLTGLMRGSFNNSPVVLVDHSALLSDIRGAILSVLLPLGTIITGFWAGAFAAHQLQVRGLWTPSLIAPAPERLWLPGRGDGLSAGFEKIGWAVLKAVILVTVSIWAIRAEWSALQRLSAMEFPALAEAAGDALLQSALPLAIVLMIVGVADYGLRHLRFESMLMTTAEEQREDQRVMEGDLSLRSKRRRLVRAWRGDAPELLAGARLVVIGPAGLTLVLAGGPPSRPVTVRTAAQGNTGLQLRRSATATRLPLVEAPELARRLARHASSGSPLPLPLPAELAAEVAGVWPAPP